MSFHFSHLKNPRNGAAVHYKKSLKKRLQVMWRPFSLMQIDHFNYKGNLFNTAFVIKGDVRPSVYI